MSDRIATFIQWLAAVNLFIALFNLLSMLWSVCAAWRWPRPGRTR